MMFKIRLAEPDRDAEAVRDIYAPYVLNTAVTFEMDVPSVSDMHARMSNNTRYPWLVVEREDGLVVGYSYASAFRERIGYRYTAMSAIYLSPEAQGLGLGRQLYAALITMLRRMGFIMLMALITSPNEASEMLHRKMGFEQCALYRHVGIKFGEWRSAATYGLQLCDSLPDPTNPPALLSVAEALESPECAELVRSITVTRRAG